jgi:hypothetical protein
VARYLPYKFKARESSEVVPADGLFSSHKVHEGHNVIGTLGSFMTFVPIVWAIDLLPASLILTQRQRGSRKG